MPELPGVEPLEPGGVDGVDGKDGVVVDGVVELDDDGDVVVVDEPFGLVVCGLVVCGLVVVELGGVDGVVGEGLDGWLPLTSPPSEVVAPAGVEPPTIPDSGFFAKASTVVTTAIDKPNAATVARATFRQRRERTTRSTPDHSASMRAPRSRPFGPGAPGGGDGAPGARSEGMGGGPMGPGGGTFQDPSRVGTSLVFSGSGPAPLTRVQP